jgi:quinol-cytochrome oxidoreductase complex cytochrome b subunit
VNQQKEFYPDYLIEILLVIFLIVELIATLALLYPPSIGRQIDFSAPFSPKPEWYFLWLYQLIRYFPGKWIIIGTMMIPLTAVLVLIFIPLIDRSKHGRLKALIAGTLLLLSFGLLTIFAILNP